MRRAAIFALLLAGCSTVPKPASPDDLYRHAETLLNSGRLKEALAEADAGLRREPSWRFRLLKAETLLSSGRAPAATEVLDSAAAPDVPEMRARWIVSRSRALEQLADYRGAQSAIDQAQAIAKPLNNPLLDAEIEFRAANLHFRRNEIPEAETKFRDVMKIGEAHHDLYLQARSTGNLGVLFLNQFRYEDAIYWEQKAQAAFEQLGSQDSAAKALGNLGWCYYRLGDLDKALDYSKSAEAKSRESGNQRDQEIWLGNIGSMLFDSGDVHGAIAKYQAALDLAQSIGDKRSSGVWMYNLGLAYIKLGDFNSAERYNNQALKLKSDLTGRAEFYPGVSEAKIALGRKQFDQAEKLFRAVLAEGGQDPTPTLEAKSGLAGVFAATGAFARADEQFQSTIAAIDHERAGITADDYKLSYLASLMEFYESYVDFLVSRGKPERAIEVIESSRARLLDEKLRAAGRGDRAVSAAALKQFSRSSGAILLSYWLAPERSFLFAVTPGAIELRELPGSKQIAPLVETYRASIEGLGDPLDSEVPAGKKLSAMLLDPVRPLLAPGTRVIVVPDRALHGLNFETLPDPEIPSRYFIDRVTLAVAPSLSILADRRGPSNPRHSILLIGNPEPAVEEYPRLPYAQKEMEMIESDFSAADRVAVEGAGAYPAAYRESEPAKFSWIHFAAHARASADRPLDSALILSRRDSGYALAARDIMNVPLNADLVTLSACRGAGARAYSGEGLVGLSWAFLRAGARSVIAGLWDVTDMSTARLMADFYSQLTNHVAPADALRQAKLNLIASKGAYRKPFYWGPFQLYIGEAPLVKNPRAVRN